MSSRNIAIALLLVLSLFVFAGCGGGDQAGGSSSSSRARFSFAGNGKEKAPRPGKEPAMASRSGYSEADADLSPEASMKRDMNRLVDKEREQVKTIKEMRGALTQGEDIIQKEERRLAEIREQIDRYDSALKRYEMASASEPRPSSRSSREPAVNAASARGSTQTRRSDRDYASPRVYNEDEEVMVYNPARDDIAFAPAVAANNAQPAVGGPKPFAGAHVSPSRPVMPAPSVRYADDENLWNPPASLYGSADLSAAVPPAPRKTDSGPRTPAVSHVKLGAAAPAAPARDEPAVTMDSDDVFTPDLILTGGR